MSIFDAIFVIVSRPPLSFVQLKWQNCPTVRLSNDSESVTMGVRNVRCLS